MARLAARIVLAAVAAGLLAVLGMAAPRHAASAEPAVAALASGRAPAPAVLPAPASDPVPAGVEAQAPSGAEAPASVPAAAREPLRRMLAAAHRQIGVTRFYDGSYVKLAYPGGDVPMDRGVCTDVVIRALRAAGIDLQREVHEDMRRQFSAYPRLWGLSRPDRNIDHRRVPNLETWLRRAGHALPPSDRAGDYRPGDLVTWRLPGGLPHIGVVSDRKTGAGHHFVVHNIGAGAQIEDVLLAWPPVGHFRIFREGGD